MFGAEFFTFSIADLRFCGKMISNLQKDKSINVVIAKLFDHFGENNFHLTDHWDADLCAIGIKNSKDGEFQIYISTYQLQKNHYFVEVEDSNKEVVLNSYKDGELIAINFDELSELVTNYFYLQPDYEQ